MDPTIRILLVDDHAIVREGIRAVLGEEPDLVVAGEAASGGEALLLMAGLKPDLVLMDLKMPGPSAAETIKKLKAQWPAIQVLVFTSFAADADLAAVISAGAAGVLLKDALREDLVRAIRAVAAGQSWIDGSTQQRLLSLLRKPAPATVMPLTEREASVLELLAGGSSNKQIARQLDLTEGTVKGYVSQILAKLGVEDRTKAAIYAVQHGLVQLPPPASK